MSLLACRTEDQPLNVLVRSRLPELILNSAVVRAGAACWLLYEPGANIRGSLWGSI